MDTKIKKRSTSGTRGYKSTAKSSQHPKDPKPRDMQRIESAILGVEPTPQVQDPESNWRAGVALMIMLLLAAACLYVVTTPAKSQELNEIEKFMTTCGTRVISQVVAENLKDEVDADRMIEIHKIIQERVSTDIEMTQLIASPSMRVTCLMLWADANLVDPTSLTPQMKRTRMPSKMTAN